MSKSAAQEIAEDVSTLVRRLSRRLTLPFDRDVQAAIRALYALVAIIEVSEGYIQEAEDRASTAEAALEALLDRDAGKIN